MHNATSAQSFGPFSCLRVGVAALQIPVVRRSVLVEQFVDARGRAMMNDHLPTPSGAGAG
eukprot:15445354-Alexandrium_andersonii.AAC.1